MLRSELRADNAAFDHAVAGWRMRDEAGRDGHFQDDIFFAGRTFHGDQGSAGAYIDCGAKFKDGPASRVGTVYKNGKGNIQALPSPGLALGFTHGRILKDMSAVAEITQVSVAGMGRDIILWSHQ